MAEEKKEETKEAPSEKIDRLANKETKENY